MLCSELIGGMPALNVSRIVTDSRKAGPDTLFVCLTGFSQDGHDYAAGAYRNGCRLFLAQKKLDLPDDAAVVYVPDTHAELTRLAAQFYSYPSRSLRIYAVTGTKGKTTSALMAWHILNDNGIPAGYIGTVGIWYGDRKIPTLNTTPDCLILNQAMRDMVRAGITVLVMEISSQAEKLGRTDGIRFEAAFLTNLYPDHIGPGEHADMEEYLSCKYRILTCHNAGGIYCNADQPEVLQLTASIPGRHLFGTSALAESPAASVALLQNKRGTGVRFDYDGIPCFVPLPGTFNVSNALIALTIGHLEGLRTDRMARSLSSFSAPGRMESVPAPENTAILIDYAHNGASLSSALKALREYGPGRLLCLFGSVGGRTQIRRSEMGRAAAKLADLCILTSDNPDFENPADIIRDIAVALEEVPGHCPHMDIPDRKSAIEFAVSQLHPGDILLLAGKGHENYQLIEGSHIPFSEKEIVADCLKSME